MATRSVLASTTPLRQLLLKSTNAPCRPLGSLGLVTPVAAGPTQSRSLSSAAFFTPARFPSNLILPPTGRPLTAPKGYFTSSTLLPPSRRSFFSSSATLNTIAPPFPSTASTNAAASGSASQSVPPPPNELPLTRPEVAKYLAVIAGMVFAIVVVGGMTRLTESGLSITEWNLVTGVLPPLGVTGWESEFEKYRKTPEWRLQNQHITLSEFKSIYLWEWSHRILGRVIGLAFILPIPYFVLRRRVSSKVTAQLLGLGTLIGGQGALGWYMVKSGLDEKSVQELGGIARVSQYRLAAHLGMAFAVYAGCVRVAMAIGRDWKITRGKGLAGWESPIKTLEGLNSQTVGRVRVLVNALTGLIFLTALSGAFVAGLDAGLIYNEFPYMGEHIHPPKTELMDPRYARKEDKSDKWWRNMLENPVTAQFDHRVLAMTTFASIVSLFLFVRRPSVRSQLPPTTLRLIKGTMHMSILQVALGISTLVYLVPIHLAATHQAGSLVLLTLAVASGASLRRPNAAIRQVVRTKFAAQSAPKIH
ncbi:COX15-CtaA-domain-containing protein [Meredithblackwellia eburnea MCA 4105]